MYNDFTVVRSFMKQTTVYDPIALRPYTTNYDRSVEEILSETTEGGNNINSLSLSAAANQFLQPSAVAKGVADIVNGFDTSRFSFFMEVVENTGSLSAGVRYILTGYTDHVGAVNNMGRMHMDPNMKMYINNVYMLRDTQVKTPNGIITRSNVADNLHVLVDHNAGNIYGGDASFYSQRPEDIFAKLSFNNDETFADMRGTGIDQRARITTPRGSSRRNDSRPNYLAETIKSFKNASNEQDTSMDYDGVNNSDVWSMSRDYMRESSGAISTNRLMNALTTQVDYLSAGCVSYADFMRVLPNLDHVTEVFLMSSVQQSKEYQPGQGEDWRSSNFETISATVISQVAPAIMTDCLMARVHLLATNDTYGAQHDVRILDVGSFTENIDMTPFIQQFISRFEREVLDDISKFGQVSYQVECTINLTYDSTFMISLNGEPMVSFTSPSFCDSLYAPILTSDATDIDNMANDIETMLYNVNGDTRRMHNDSLDLGNSL